MWGIYIPIFRPLAPLMWEENELTDSRKDRQNVLATIHNEISNSITFLIFCHEQESSTAESVPRRGPNKYQYVGTPYLSSL